MPLGIGNGEQVAPQRVVGEDAGRIPARVGGPHADLVQRGTIGGAVGTDARHEGSSD